MAQTRVRRAATGDDVEQVSRLRWSDAEMLRALDMRQRRELDRLRARNEELEAEARALRAAVSGLHARLGAMALAWAQAQEQLEQVQSVVAHVRAAVGAPQRVRRHRQRPH